MTRPLAILALILATTLSRAPADPRLSARWDGPGRATVQWAQQQRSCLSVAHATGETAFISCYERFPASIQAELGGPQTDGTIRPQVGDVYVLTTPVATYRALLQARPTYVPVLRR